MTLEQESILNNMFFDVRVAQLKKVHTDMSIAQIREYITPIHYREILFPGVLYVLNAQNNSFLSNGKREAEFQKALTEDAPLAYVEGLLDFIYQKTVKEK